MKRLTILLAALTLAAAQAALPQAPGGGQGGPGGNPVEQMAHDLNLTDAQKTQVQKIYDDMRPKRNALRAELKDATPEQRTAKMEALRQELLQKLGGVLTPAQMQKFKDMEQQRRQQMQGGAAPH